MRRVATLFVMCCALAACASQSGAQFSPPRSGGLSPSTNSGGQNDILPSIASTSSLRVGAHVTVRGEKEPVLVATPATPLSPGDPVPAVVKPALAAVAAEIDPPEIHTGPATISSTGAFVPASMKRPNDVVSTSDQGGQAGVLVDPGSSDGSGAVYVAMTAYDNVELNYPPAGSTALDVLYAPTTHGPDGDCFELGADYWLGNSGFTDTARFVRLFDFCDNGGAFESAYDRVIDSNFVSSYVRVFTNGNGYPEFTSEQLRESDGNWHALIYNYSTSAWEDWGYTDSGTNTYNGDWGWSIFETHYAAGQTCSGVPLMSTDGLRVYTASGWTLVGSTTGENNSYYLQCFSAASPTYYTATTTEDYYQWTVASVTPTPAPTPRPMPTGPNCAKNPSLCG